MSSKVCTSELTEAAQAELDDLLALGGAFEAIETMKARLVASQSQRTRRIDRESKWSWESIDSRRAREVSPLGGCRVRSSRSTPQSKPSW